MLGALPAELDWRGRLRFKRSDVLAMADRARKRRGEVNMPDDGFRRDDPTEEEVEATVAEQMRNLPQWFLREEARKGGRCRKPRAEPLRERTGLLPSENWSEVCVTLSPDTEPGAIIAGWCAEAADLLAGRPLMTAEELGERMDLPVWCAGRVLAAVRARGTGGRAAA